MTVTNLVLPNLYRDSVMLMRISQELERLDGVRRATAMMGTPNNRSLLSDAGLLTDEGDSASPNDLILAIEASPDLDSASVVSRAQELLRGETGPRGPDTATAPRSLNGALENMPEANLALISVPGQYAAYEAAKALDLGLNVFLFSDNVSIEDEVALKARASKSGLLMLGPDCGTAMVGGMPLGFANAVARGRVGLVSASGTGLQQVMCLLDAAGEGVSQALGVGGRDLDDRVGGLMMMKCLELLDSDPGTDVIVLISKPPGPRTRQRVLDALSRCSKPCVVCFLDVEKSPEIPEVYFESRLDGTARRALKLLGSGSGADRRMEDPFNVRLLMELDQGLGDSRLIRGLYSGGTLRDEAGLVLRENGFGTVSGESEGPGEISLTDYERDGRHRLVDLGDDSLTVGRPHPIIDLRLRCELLVASASEPDVGIILMDVVLGYGAHPDPASELTPVLRKCQGIAEDLKRALAVIIVLCGTSGDPQSVGHQKASLESAGAIVVRSNAQAALIAAALARGDLSLV